MKTSVFENKLKFKFFSLFFLLNFYLAFPQYEFFLKHGDLNKEKYETYLNNLKTTKNELNYLLECKKIKNFAVKEANKELELELDFEILNTKIVNNTNNFRKNKTLIINSLQQLIKEAQNNELHDLKVRVLLLKSKVYWLDLKNYELAFETYFEIEKNISNSNLIDVNNKAKCYHSIASAYFFFNDHKKAIHYYKKAIPSNRTKINIELRNKIINNIGYDYSELKKLDSATYFFKKLLKENNDEKWKGIAKGNLGYIYYLEKKYKDAIKLLNESLITSLKFNDNLSSVTSYVTLANIYISNKDFLNAKSNLVKAEKFLKLVSNDTGIKEVFAKDFYLSYSKYYRKLKNNGLALLYLDSNLVVKEKLTIKYNNLILTHSEQKNILHKNRLKTQLLKQQQLKLYFVLICLLFVSIVSFGIYFYQKRNHKKERQIQDLKLENIKNEKEIALKNLNDFTEKLIAQNKIIELLENKTSEKNSIANELKKKAILTPEDWEEFQFQFDKVHSGFLFALKNTYRDLTPSEIRYLALTKLKLSPKEMATILGISDSSVRVTLHRVSKKLHITDKKSLEDIIDNIN